MKRGPRGLLALGGTVAACLALGSLAAGAQASAAARPPRACCFVNERYAGVCRLVPEPGESCAGILAYLNNPSSSGKTYCDSTDVRGGWARADCRVGEPKKEPTPPQRHGSAPAPGPPAPAGKADR